MLDEVMTPSRFDPCRARRMSGDVAAAIVIHNLTKRFPAGRRWSETVLRPFHHRWMTVLDGVALEVRRGEVLGLLGLILGFVLRLRGVTCLHASAIAVRDRAIALLGPASSPFIVDERACSIRG